MIGKVRFRDLVAGDEFDLLELDACSPSGRYPLDETTRMAAESQLAVVLGEGDGGRPFTVESDQNWVVHTTEGSFGVDPGWEVTLEGHDASYE